MTFEELCYEEAKRLYKALQATEDIPDSDDQLVTLSSDNRT
jgi:hypothetical protein